MTCPKCGNVQLLSVACTRCGAAMEDSPSPLPGPKDPLSVGEILGKAFYLYFKDLPLFLVLTLVAFSPLLLLSVVRFKVWDTPIVGDSTALDLLAILVRLFCDPFAIALVARGVFRRLQGEEASLGDSLRTGFGALFPVLGVALLQVCAFVGGYILCVIPALAFWVMYSVAMPALLAEGVGPRSAMTRSAHLTKGYRWPLFGVMLVILFLQMGLDFALELVWEEPPADKAGPRLLAGDLLGLFPAGLTAVAFVLAYHRLRGIKESYGLAETASVFD